MFRGIRFCEAWNACPGCAYRLSIKDIDGLVDRCIEMHLRALAEYHTYNPALGLFDREQSIEVLRQLFSMVMAAIEPKGETC